MSSAQQRNDNRQRRGSNGCLSSLPALRTPLRLVAYRIPPFSSPRSSAREATEKKREREKKKINKGSSLTERELIIINPARALLSGPDPIDDDHASIRHFDSLFVSSQFTKRRLPTSLSLALWERHSARRKWPLSIRGEWCTWESIASAFSATIRRAPAAPASAAYLSIDLIHFPLKKKKERETRWIGCTGWVPLFVLSSAPFSRFQLVQRIDIFIGSINGYSRFLFSFPLGPGFFSLFLPTTGRRRLILTRNLRDRLVVNRIDHFLYIFFSFFDWLMIFLHVLMFSLLFLCDLQGFEPQPVDCCRQAHPPRTQLATQFVSQFFCIPILR